MAETLWRQGIPVVLLVLVVAVFVVPLFRWRQPPPPPEHDDSERAPSPSFSERALAAGVVAVCLLAVLLPLALWLHDAYGLRPGWINYTVTCAAVAAGYRPFPVAQYLRTAWQRIVRLRKY